MQNYYDLLGVSRGASERDIRQAYRKLARQYHPDVNKNDAVAEDKFKEINEAYTVLSDKDSRQKYDRFGENWKRADQSTQTGNTPRGGMRWEHFGGGRASPGSGGWDVDSVFDDLFGGMGSRERRWRRPAREYQVEVTLEESFHGATRALRTEDGRSLEVKIPAGVDNGSRVHIAPDGPQGGDIYLNVSVTNHPVFRRDGRDLYVDVDVSVEDAVLGTELPAPTPTGRVALTVPPNTPNERRFRLTGQGMPALSGGDPRGDLYVTVKLRLPTQVSEEELEMFRQLRELREARREANDAQSD